MGDYVPLGEMVSVGDDLPCYVAKPPEPSKCAVIMFTDMFGVHTGRHKQICDDLASNGFLTICPDFFVDTPYMKKRHAWGTSCGCVCEVICGILCKTFDKITKVHAWEVSLREKVEDKVVPWLRSQGATKFVTVGFCWGSYGAMRCCALPDFACGVSFHPSTEGFCKSAGEDALAICRSVKVPQLVVATSQEPDTWRPGGAAQCACEEVLPGRITWKLEDKMNHGYMTRGDTKDAAILEAVKRGFQDMFAFFKRHAA
jgi:dienelactone hydrolase